MNLDETPRVQTVRELGLSLRSLDDIQTLIGAAHDLDGLILSEADLSPEFFNLKTGLAGEAFQKFTNYRLRVALVLPDFAAYGERFAQLAHEHSSHLLIRFVHSEEGARAWLSS